MTLSLLCQSFANFFSDMIRKLHTSLFITRISTSLHFPPPFTPPNFSSIICVITDEVSELLSQFRSFSLIVNVIWMLNINVNVSIY